MKKHTEDNEANHCEQIGNSRVTQALGASFVDATVAFVVGTVAVSIGAYYGRRHSRVIGWLFDRLDNLYKAVEDLFPKGNGKKGDVFAALTTGVAAGTLISKLASIPGFRRGWKNATCEQNLLRHLREEHAKQSDTIKTLIAERGALKNNNATVFAANVEASQGLGTKEKSV